MYQDLNLDFGKPWWHAPLPVNLSLVLPAVWSCERHQHAGINMSEILFKIHSVLAFSIFCLFQPKRGSWLRGGHEVVAASDSRAADNSSRNRRGAAAASLQPLAPARTEVGTRAVKRKP